MLRSLLVAWLVLTIAIALTALLMPGIEVDGGVLAVAVIAVVFALVNLVLGPVVHLVALPLKIVTLGLISFVVNGFLFLVTDWLVADLEIDGLLPAIVGSILITVIVVGLDRIVQPRMAPAI